MRKQSFILYFISVNLALLLVGCYAMLKPRENTWAGLKIMPNSPDPTFWGSGKLIDVKDDIQNREIKFSLNKPYDSLSHFSVWIAIIEERVGLEVRKERLIKKRDYHDEYFKYILKNLKDDTNYKIIISVIDKKKRRLLDQKVLLYRTLDYQFEIFLLNPDDDPAYSITNSREIKSNISKFELSFSVQLKDENGAYIPPDEVNILKDGVNEGQDQPVRIESNGNEYNYKVLIKLYPEQETAYELQVIKSGIVFKQPIGINVRKAKKFLKPNVRDLAVFLVVQDYPDKPLYAQFNDAEAIGSILYDNFGFDTLIIRNPDIRRMDELLDSLQDPIPGMSAENIYEDRQLLFYLGGHGFYKKTEKIAYFGLRGAKQQGTGAGARKSFREIGEEIDKIKCASIMVIISGCHSGAFFNKLPQSVKVKERQLSLVEELNSHKRYAITSALRGENSFENGNGTDTTARSYFAMEIEEYLDKFLEKYSLKDDPTRAYYPASVLGSDLAQKERKNFRISRSFFGERNFSGGHDFLFIPIKTREKYQKQ